MTMQNVSNSVVKQLNLQSVFAFIYENGPVSVRDISTGLSLSVPTVTQNLKTLCGRGIVLASGKNDSTGGRKAWVYAVRSAACHAVGLDLTRHDATAVIVDLRGQTVYRDVRDLEFDDCGAYYDQAASIVEEVLAAAEIDPDSVIGVGISLPAIISADGTHTTNTDPLGGKVVRLSDFSTRLPFPCRLENDASAGGFAEFWAAGAFRDNAQIKNLAYLSVSKTVGGAVMVGGAPFLGDDTHAAEFGHMTVVPEGEDCYCGQRGCAYAYINTSILSAAAGGSLEGFFTRLAGGEDDQAKAIWKEYLRFLSLTVNNIRALFDCEVIIGGYLSAYLEPYMEDLKRLCAERNIFEGTADYVRLSRHRESVSAVGAALTFVQEWTRKV